MAWEAASSFEALAELPSKTRMAYYLLTPQRGLLLQVVERGCLPCVLSIPANSYWVHKESRHGHPLPNPFIMIDVAMRIREGLS
jgi:hypothetical protein